MAKGGGRGPPTQGGTREEGGQQGRDEQGYGKSGPQER